MKQTGSCLRIWMVVGFLILIALPGCDGANDGSNAGVFVSATPADLQLRVFDFSEGGAFSPSFAGVPVTLTMGDFEESNSGPFMLTAGGVAALGVVQTAPCEFAVDSSAFMGDADPKDGDILNVDFCEVDSQTGRLSAENAAIGMSSISKAPTSLLQNNLASCTEFAPGQLTVWFQEGTTLAEATNVFGTGVISKVIDNFYLLRVPNGREIAFISVLESLPVVQNAQLNCIARPQYGSSIMN